MGGARASRGRRRARVIVIAGADGSVAAITNADTPMAERPPGLTLLHAIEWLPEHEPRASAHFNVPEFRGHLINDARERLRSLASEESNPRFEIDEVVVSGRAHREILRTAEDTAADLIVMGAQGRGGLGLALFGSTTQQVVRSAACPVLTVRGAVHA